MDFATSFLKMIFGIFVIPVCIPIGLVKFKNLLDTRDTMVFKRLIQSLPDHCSQKQRKYIRGSKRQSIAYNYTGAIVMAIPFCLIFFYKFLFSEPKVALAFFGSAFFIGFISSVFRSFTVKLDYVFYAQEIPDVNMRPIKSIENVIKYTAISVWVGISAAFYTMGWMRIS